MGTQTNFSGGRSGLGWGPFLEGLRQGDASAYLLLVALAVIATVALAVIATVAFWAGGNLMKGDARR